MMKYAIFSSASASLISLESEEGPFAPWSFESWLDNPQHALCGFRTLVYLFTL